MDRFIKLADEICHGASSLWLALKPSHDAADGVTKEKTADV